MKKNLTKKLMLSVLTLAFAVVSLGASTFAWFTMSGTATVGTFEGSVIGGTGLDIAITPVGGYTNTTKWYSNGIPNTVVQEVVDTYNGKGWKFNAVTPQDILTTSKSFQTQAEALAKAATASAKGQYVIFDLHFKLTDPNAVDTTFELYLNELDVANKVTPTEWTVDAGYSYNTGEDNKLKAGDKVTYDLLTATRVAFITVAELNSSTGTVASLNKVYEEAAATVAAGKNTTGFNSFGALEYYNTKMSESKTVATNANATLADYLTLDTKEFKVEGQEEKLKASCLKNINESGEYVQVLVGKIQNSGRLTVTVAVWVEGWDSECINAIFSQSLTVDMKFELVDPTKSE